MSMTGLPAFDSTLQKTHEWLNELQHEMNLETRQTAYLVLRAGIHALRDRLPVDEVAHLGAQLPMLIRGFYYEGWRPSDSPLRIRTKDEFLALMRESLQVAPAGQESSIDAEEAVRAVFRLLGRQLSPGEIESIRRIMPEGLRELWSGVETSHPRTSRDTM
ncbi:MAG: DUF2267 domain-containing protein [FCB group bacterium]|nr:DUF2267 domain-containing protein [FCB group bacterium]